MPFQDNTFYDVIAKNSDQLQDIEISLDTAQNTSTPLLSKVDNNEKNYHMFKVKGKYTAEKKNIKRYEGFLGIEVPIKDFIDHNCVDKFLVLQYQTANNEEHPYVNFLVRCAGKYTITKGKGVTNNCPAKLKLYLIQPEDDNTTSNLKFNEAIFSNMGTMGITKFPGEDNIEIKQNGMLDEGKIVARFNKEHLLNLLFMSVVRKDDQFLYTDNTYLNKIKVKDIKIVYTGKVKVALVDNNTIKSIHGSNLNGSFKKK